MIGGMNPWLAMWTQPRKAIRSILQINPKYGVFYLAAIYSLQSYFYFANYWSLGISMPFYQILIAGLVLSPFIGMVWVYFAGWILYFTGRWLEGRAPMLHLRAAVAWSKIPTSISLLMWFVLLATHAEYAFILDAGGPSSIFVNLITTILGVWSFVILVQELREIQHFSIGRSIINVIIAWVISFFFVLLFFALLRYFYLLTV